MFILFNPEDINSIVDRQMDMDSPPLQHDEFDLAYSIKGMYRILDLISEQGSGGLGKYLTATSLVRLFSLSIWYQSIRSSYPKTPLRHSSIAFARAHTCR